MKSPRAGGIVAGERLRLAVELIVASCGESVRQLLTGHPLLPGKVIMQLSRTTPERQRFELDQIRAGRRPFTVKTTVFDTTGYDEVISRLARASGLVNKVRQLAAIVMAEGECPLDDKSPIRMGLTAVLRSCRQLRAIIHSAPRGDHSGRCDANKLPSVSQRSWTGPTTIKPNDLVGDLHRAHAFIEKCARDLPRATHLVPTRFQVHSCLIRVFKIIQDVLRILAGLDSLEFRGQRHQKPVIATHRQPDCDALVAVWLVQRYLVRGGSQVVFLPYGHDWTRGPVVDYVLDMWGLYQPSLSLFDHRTPAMQDRNSSCTTRLVYEYLQRHGESLAHLSDLVELVHDGDSIRRRRGSAAYQASSRNGLHEIVRNQKQARHSDDEMCGIL